MQRDCRLQVGNVFFREPLQGVECARLVKVVWERAKVQTYARAAEADTLDHDAVAATHPVAPCKIRGVRESSLRYVVAALLTHPDHGYLGRNHDDIRECRGGTKVRPC
jgi:hypothetical protein